MIPLTHPHPEWNGHRALVRVRTTAPAPGAVVSKSYTPSYVPPWHGTETVQPLTRATVARETGDSMNALLSALRVLPKIIDVFKDVANAAKADSDGGKRITLVEISDIVADHLPKIAAAILAEATPAAK